jgi:hypothetical protein
MPVPLTPPQILPDKLSEFFLGILDTGQMLRVAGHEILYILDYDGKKDLFFVLKMIINGSFSQFSLFG